MTEAQLHTSVKLALGPLFAEIAALPLADKILIGRESDTPMVRAILARELTKGLEKMTKEKIKPIFDKWLVEGQPR